MHDTLRRSLSTWHEMSGVIRRSSAPALQLEEVVQQPAAGVGQVRDGVGQRGGFAPVVVDAAVQRIRDVVRRAEPLQGRYPPVARRRGFYSWTAKRS